MKVKCPNCNGTGKEICELHGSHKCIKCNGQGCIEQDKPIIKPVGGYYS